MKTLAIGGGFATLAGLTLLVLASSPAPKPPAVDFVYEHASAQEQADWLNRYGLFLKSMVEQQPQSVEGEQTVFIESIDPARRALTIKVEGNDGKEPPSAEVQQSEDFKKSMEKVAVHAQAKMCEPHMLDMLEKYGTVITWKAAQGSVELFNVETSPAACNVLRR